MQESGFLPEGKPKADAPAMWLDGSRPPLPGARLGRDLEGRLGMVRPELPRSREST